MNEPINDSMLNGMSKDELVQMLAQMMVEDDHLVDTEDNPADRFASNVLVEKPLESLLRGYDEVLNRSEFWPVTTSRGGCPLKAALLKHGQDIDVLVHVPGKDGAIEATLTSVAADLLFASIEAKIAAATEPMTSDSLTVAIRNAVDPSPIASEPISSLGATTSMSNVPRGTHENEQDIAFILNLEMADATILNLELHLFTELPGNPKDLESVEGRPLSDEIADADEVLSYDGSREDKYHLFRWYGKPEDLKDQQTLIALRVVRLQESR